MLYAYNPLGSCLDIVIPLYALLSTGDHVSANLTRDNVVSLMNYCELAETENRFSKPTVWIGIYIAIASFFCTIAMGADLLHGLRDNKMIFPCKYFTLNAASITVITVAMKLPVDLSSLMPSHVDQETKLGSMAFMCTMMANLMPSLASMDNKTLLANVIGLVILVITIVVNICIEISTGVICDENFYVSATSNFYVNYTILAIIYVVMLLWLLIILISSAITIPSSKQILEFKYQAKGKKILEDQDNLTPMVENLRRYVRRYWVMAESGSPQFAMASNPLSSTPGIICLIIIVLQSAIVCLGHRTLYFKAQSFYAPAHGLLTVRDQYGSDYKWSMGFIFMAQFIGVGVGSLAPIFRWFNLCGFYLFTNERMVFKVEKYWIQKLCQWKEGHITFLSSGSWSKTLVHNLKIPFLGLCIGIQKVIVISSKMMVLIALVITIFFKPCFYCCFDCWDWLVARLFTLPIVPRIDDVQDLCDYVLQLEDEMDLGKMRLKGISNALNKLIQKGENEQNKDLLVFLDTSTGFKGVENFDSDQVEALTSAKLVNSWSLPVVTLTCIAISLPNMLQIKVDRLLKSVREGLLVTHLVEEIINNTCEYGNIRKATMTLWHEVEEKCMWLENTIEKSTFRGKTSVEILGWFANKAEQIVLQINNTTNGEVVVNTPKKLILANSMHRVARTILFNYQTNVELSSEEELFALLSSMITDILSACFTNIPRVIKTKCRESAIEKRKGSVESAAKLFGRTEEILKRLEVWELPSMDPDKMAFIDEWRLHLQQSIP